MSSPGPGPRSAWSSPGEAFRHFDALEARLTAAVSERLLDLAALRPGHRVLDLGAGSGEPALRAAGRVGPVGRVLAVDPSAAMLDLLRERALHAGIPNIDCLTAEAEHAELSTAAFDATIARWSLMYMAAPERALANAHRALRPGAPLVAAFWAEPERVEFATLARRELAHFVPIGLPRVGEPGVCRFGDEGALRGALEAAGFAVELVEEHQVPVVEAADGAGIVDWVLAFGGEFRERVRALPEAQQQRWAQAVAAAAERHREGPVVRLGGVTRLVRARRTTRG